MKLLKLVIIAIITILSANNMLSQEPPSNQSGGVNTFKMSINCHPPIFYSKNLPSVLEPSVVCGDGDVTFSGDNEANIIEFTFWGDGTKEYDVAITTATNKYPPNQTGPYAYLETEWSFFNALTENNSISPGVWYPAIKNSKFEDISPLESHCDGQFIIKLKAVKGWADADFSKVDQVPFIFELSVTD